MHGRHFTFKSFMSECAVTLVVCGVDGALANKGNPLVMKGAWLQVFLPQLLLTDLEHRITSLLVRVINKQSCYMYTHCCRSVPVRAFCYQKYN